MHDNQDPEKTFNTGVTSITVRITRVLYKSYPRFNNFTQIWTQIKVFTSFSYKSRACTYNVISLNFFFFLSSRPFRCAYWTCKESAPEVSLLNWPGSSVKTSTGLRQQAEHWVLSSAWKLSVKARYPHHKNNIQQHQSINRKHKT